MKHAPAIIITALAALVIAFAAWKSLHAVSMTISAVVEQVTK